MFKIEHAEQVCLFQDGLSVIELERIGSGRGGGCKQPCSVRILSTEPQGLSEWMSAARGHAE
jgi:hypothetical protein